MKRLSGPTLRHEIDRAPAHTDHKRAEPRGLISAVHPREALRQGPVAAPAVEEMTAEQRAQAVDETAVVKIWPLPRRDVRVFDPKYVTVEFRQDTEGE